MRRRGTSARSLPSEEKLPVCCAAWVGQGGKGALHHVLFARGDDSTPASNAFEICSYDPNSSVVSEALHAWSSSDGRPQAVAVHPGGGGILVAFADSCKLFEISVKRQKVNISAGSAGKEIDELKGAGTQQFLVFSRDGTKLATGTHDGHLRVFHWPSMNVLIDDSQTLKKIKDLDISYDSALLAVTSGECCQVWDLQFASLATTLRHKGDSLDCCRFSRDGKKPYFYVSINRGGKGYIGVWVLEHWDKCLGLKKVQHTYITSLAITYEGKRMAIGSSLGQITVLGMKELGILHRVRNVQLGPVRFMEFTQNGRELLSVAQDSTAEVYPVHLEREWKEWELYLILASLIILSLAITFGIYDKSDSFWNFPMGRLQPARPPIEAIYPM